MSTEPSVNLDTYLAQFESLQSTREAPAGIRQMRQEAMTHFSQLGFPTTRLEDWRFTNVERIAKSQFKLAEEATVGAAQFEAFSFSTLSGPRLIFVNGRFAPALSNTDGATQTGVTVENLSHALTKKSVQVEPHLAQLASYRDRAFPALNTALWQDGAFVSVPNNTTLNEPIHLLFISTAPSKAAATYPRVLVVLGENSRSTVIEEYVSVNDSPHFTNAVTEIDIGPGSTLEHYKVLSENLAAYHVASSNLRLGRDSTTRSTSVTLGGRLVRNDIGALLRGEGAECTLNGLYLANSDQLVDSHTIIDHAVPHCNSHELYKGVLNGHGRSVFNGKIIVRIDAQKTDAKQTNQALLLSEDAQINTKPELEIFADDVKCTHGATVGQLDDDALFYLRARGLDEAQARRVLIHAFANDVLSRISLDSLRAYLETALLKQLPMAVLEARA